jgi:hypothetical protein
MKTAVRAIKVGRDLTGWVWKLVDDNDVTTMTGTAFHQVEATETAWHMARTYHRSSGDSRIQYPEIIGGRLFKHRSHHQEVCHVQF